MASLLSDHNPIETSHMPILNDSELSFYALDISSISELDVLHKENVKILRIMHCNNLVSLSGIENYQNLTELNCSSNSLNTISHIFSLKQLTTLNLSCNNIAIVPDLSSMISLEILNLSHNRISDLSGFINVFFDI